MINQDFKENWKNILKFNSNLDILDNPLESNQVVKIPLTNINIDAYLLYYLFELCYPKFINVQLNVLDLVLSDFDIENVVLNAYLYEMTKPGIFDTVEELPKESLVITQSKIPNLEELFKELQSRVLKSHQVRISSIRIFKKRGIDLINRHYESLEKTSIYESLESLIDLIQTLFTDQLVILYPEPNTIKFLRDCFTILNEIKLSDILTFLMKFMPPMKISLVLNSLNPIYLIFEKKASNAIDIDLNLKWLKLLTNEEDLKTIRSDLKSDSLVKFDLSKILSFLAELFEAPIPIDKDRFKALLQKFLFGIRSYQFHWQLSPQPVLYNPLIRYIFRLFGVNFNLRNLSHWSIPDFIFSLFSTYIGLNSKILLLITNNSEIRNSFIIHIENGSLIDIEPIKSTNFVSDNLEILREKYSAESSYLTEVIKIDQELINKIFDVLVFNFPKLSLFPLLKLLKMFKKDQYLEMYPKIPPYQLLKSRSKLSLAKDILTIFIDMHEF